MDAVWERIGNWTGSFDGLVASLRIVFTASVETGNPVRWC
jgi:hypothetical protein